MVIASDLTETQACDDGSCPPTIWVMIFPESSCPSSHKYAYRHGEYCCRTNKEKIAIERDGDLCDGSEIGIDSLCCENDDWKLCGNRPCINHKDAFKNDQGKVE